MTVVLKWVFPVLWFVGLAIFIGYSLDTGIGQERPMTLIGPVLMGPMGLGMTRFFLWDLADRVDDHGTPELPTDGSV